MYSNFSKPTEQNRALKNNVDENEEENTFEKMYSEEDRARKDFYNPKVRCFGKTFSYAQVCNSLFQTSPFVQHLKKFKQSERFGEVNFNFNQKNKWKNIIDKIPFDGTKYGICNLYQKNLILIPSSVYINYTKSEKYGREPPLVSMIISNSSATVEVNLKDSRFEDHSAISINTGIVMDFVQNNPNFAMIPINFESDNPEFILTHSIYTGEMNSLFINGYLKSKEINSIKVIYGFYEVAKVVEVAKIVDENLSGLTRELYNISNFYRASHATDLNKRCFFEKIKQNSDHLLVPILENKFKGEKENTLQIKRSDKDTIFIWSKSSEWYTPDVLTTRGIWNDAGFLAPKVLKILNVQPSDKNLFYLTRIKSRIQVVWKREHEKMPVTKVRMDESILLKQKVDDDMRVERKVRVAQYRLKLKFESLRTLSKWGDSYYSTRKRICNDIAFIIKYLIVDIYPEIVEKYKK